MKYRALIFAFLLPAFLVIVLAGCDPTLNTDGRKVKFTAVSKAPLATKTVYTRQGQTGGQTYQTIAWKEGDKIRIYCPKVEGEVFGYNDGTVTYTETDPRFSLDYIYADYSVQQIDNSDFPKSKASLANVDPNGLVWAGTQKATFYAAYPFGTKICSNLSSQLRFAIEVPVGNFGSSSSNLQTGDSTFVENMPLLAIQKDVNNGDPVNLDFYPAFSAFEFVLNSADDTNLTIDWFELFTDTEATNEFLTGLCYYDLNALSAGEHFLPNSSLSFDGGGKSIKVNVNQTASATTAASFTLFALPCTFNQLSIRVAFTPEGGAQMTKTLKLKQNNNWISFPAGRKARIHGLALEGGSKWQLNINDLVLPWIEDNQTTSFRHNISVKDKVFSGYAEQEITYEEAFGYDKYYIRLTVKIQDESDPCVKYTFTPTAPIGGYWQLSPEDVIPGSLNYFHITVDDGINGESERLRGQVMGVPVTIFVRPTAEYLALDSPAPVYAVSIHCNMSPSYTYDPLFSADSEFQGGQSDGRFSYYKFRIAK